MFTFDPVIYVCQNQHDLTYTNQYRWRGRNYSQTLSYASTPSTYASYDQATCNYFTGLVYSTAIPLILNTMFVTYYW